MTDGITPLSHFQEKRVEASTPDERRDINRWNLKSGIESRAWVFLVLDGCGEEVAGEEKERYDETDLGIS